MSDTSQSTQHAEGSNIAQAQGPGAIANVITNIFRGGDEQRALRNRQAMLQLVRNTWIKGVLEQSLHGAAMIELGLEERADAVERPWDMVVQTPDQPKRPLPSGTKIVDVFDEMNRALLILGEPGSGKTTMLLDLARDTIARAEQDPMHPIPVVFNLSSWAHKRQPIAEWMVEELDTKYNVPKKTGRPWIENNDLLLMLDGLDEVKIEHREACVKAINDFRQEYGLTPIVVCSRIADYEALITHLNLQGAVLLQPLMPQQIGQYLAGAGTELLAVRKTLQHDPTLQELAQTPLMLSVMTLAYRGMSIDNLGAFDSTEARRKHIFDAYVRRMFEWRRGNQCYSLEQTIHWLAWLAQNMSKHAQTIFLIEQIQPTWLQTETQRRIYTGISGIIDGQGLRLVVGVFLGLYVGATAGAIIGSVLGQAVGLTFGWILGLVGMLIGGWLITKSDGTLVKVKPVEVLKWSWEESVKGMIRGMVQGLIGGPILGLSVWLFGELSGGLAGGLYFWLTELGLVAGVILGLAFGLAGMLKGLSYIELETSDSPNQGIKRSARNAVIVWLISGLVLRLTGGIIGEITGGAALRTIGGLAGGLAGILIFGPVVGLNFGGIAVIRHSILRFIFYRGHHIPWNLTRFLDYATDRIFLRKVGGGYIFVHRMLQEYFASLAETPTKEVTQ
ncbi:MAG: NACHT domain-containing protein [Chloroflexi bacterium]|nr:MAG: NACHT domain-containing protein [Chloroflexota bacterium]RLC85797.1 MAG: NACHT domain-containing protein [Chloroflexota bacterium]